jgi:hypothetical protein
LGVTFSICDSRVCHVCVDSAGTNPAWSCTCAAGDGFVVTPAVDLAVYAVLFSADAEGEIVGVALG